MEKLLCVSSVKPGYALFKCLKVKLFHNCNRKDRHSWARMLRITDNFIFSIYFFVLTYLIIFKKGFIYPPQRVSINTIQSQNHTRDNIKTSILEIRYSLVTSYNLFPPNKELNVLPSSTPRIELVFGRFKVSPPRLDWGFIDTRVLLGTEASSSKLLPISGSAAQRTGGERHTAVTVPGPQLPSPGSRPPFSEP